MRLGLGLGLTARRDGFDPWTLFASGAQGVWFDRQDLSSMYQDAAGTVPAAVNSPVGKCLDKSGRGNHATQGTAASRPILRQDASGRYYLEYDGVDDGMATAAIDFTGTSKIAAIGGFTKTNVAPAAYESMVELTADPAANVNSFTVGASTLTGDASRRTWAAFITGSPASTGGVGVGVFAAPDAAVLSAQFDLTQANAANNAKLRRNGVAPVPTFAPDITPAAAFSNAPIYLGRRGGASLPFTGRDYGLIVVGRALSATEIARAERFLASRMGIAL